MSESAIIVLVGIVQTVCVFLIYRKIEAVHLATNSMKDALVAATDSAAFARGKDSQRALQAQLELQRHIDAEARAEIEKQKNHKPK